MRASYGRCKKKCDTCWRRAFHVRRSWRVDSRAPWHDTRFLFIDKVCTKESSAGIKTVMKFKKVEPEQFDCTKTTMRPFGCMRSEEHTSELQSHLNLVCRLLLEK